MRLIPGRLLIWAAAAILVVTLTVGPAPKTPVSFAAAAGDQTQVTRVTQVEKIWNDFEWEVLKLTNKERMERGLLPLSTNDFMQTVAEIRAGELTVKASHFRPDGRSFYSVYQDFDALEPGVYGENVAAGQVTPAEVVASWMRSPTHKANILGDEYVHMGVGYLYKNDRNYEEYWTQLFSSVPEVTSIAVGMVNPNIMVRITDNISDYNLILIQYNDGEVVGYLPITPEMCGGYSGAKAGNITVTVRYGELRTSFRVIPGYNQAGTIAQ